MRVSAAARLAVLALSVGCRALPDIPTATCGNAVVEPGEDCDGFGREQVACRPAGQPGACHFDCAKDPAGYASGCPVGFGCDRTAVCRRTTGSYDENEVTVPGAAASLQSGDFDGDGRADVLSLEASGAFGRARPRVTFFDRDGAPEDTWSMTKLISSPAVAAVSDDGRADLVSSTFFSLAVLLGEPERELITAISPSFYLPKTRVRLFPVLDVPLENNTPILIMTSSDGQNLLAVTSAADPSLRPVAELPAGIDALSGEPALADIDEDEQEAPCLDLVLAYRGVSEVTTYQGCEAESGAPVWRSDAVVRRLPFEPASTAVGPPLLADLNGDGHVDLFVLSAAGPYAAFGDGHALGALTPFELRLAGSSGPTAGPTTLFPIAAGDITGDGLADFVDALSLLLSERQSDDTVAYRVAHEAPLGAWREARIADFTGDARLDVVAVADGVPTLDFFLGNGSNRLNAFTIQTPRPARGLCVADLDGDSLQDLAYVEVAGDSTEADELAVSFGESSGSLSSPVAVAHLDGIEQLIGTTEHAQDAVADLLITHRLGTADGPDTGVSLVAGSGDRSLFSPILFNNYAADGLLDSANSLAVTVGAFTDEATLDVAALAIPDNYSPDNVVYGAWLLPDLRHGAAGPEKLSWEFDERFTPLGRHGDTSDLLVRLLGADLNGDGLDELVVAAPLVAEAHCLVQIGDIDRAQARLALPLRLELDQGCVPEPPLAAQDIDGDGALDLAILVGIGASRRVLVLWNDGAGGFSVDRATSVLANELDVRAFSFFRSTPGAPLRAALVTKSALRGLEALGPARSFRELAYGRPLTDGTGVVAADVDGDSVQDLVVADAGNLRVLHAALEGL